MRQGKKLLGALAMAGTAALLMSSCSASGEMESEGGLQPIKIMVAAPLTGGSAESGRDMVNGAELAAQYLNEQGGVQSGDLAGAQFVIEEVDDQESTEAATTIASRVIDDTSVFALTGFITSAQAQAAGTVLDSAGLGMVVSFAAADFLTDDADNLALVLTAVSNTGLVAGTFATEDLGAKTVGSIAGDYSFLESYYAGLDEGLANGGASNVSKQTYTDGTTDFSTLLTSIESSTPDVVLSGAFQSDAGKLASQMRSMSMDQPFVDFLGEGWGESFGAAAGSALQTGEYYQLDPMDSFPAEGTLGSEISERFQSEYGKSMPASAVHTFDSVLTIAAAIEAGATERESLIEYIPQVDGEGLLGPIKFNADLRPEERVITISKVTGPEPSDRELVSYYSAFGDGTVAGK